MAIPFRTSLSASPLGPRFLPYTLAGSARHASYLLVTVVAWPSAKGAFLTTVEWHTRTLLPPSFSVPRDPAPSPPQFVRVRTLLEREPLNAAQARERAAVLAQRNGIQLIFTVGC